MLQSAHRLDHQLVITATPHTSPVELRAVGEIDVATAETLVRTVIRAMMRDGHVALDLTGITFFDAAGVHALARLHAWAGPRLTVGDVSANVRRVLDLCGSTLAAA